MLGTVFDQIAVPARSQMWVTQNLADGVLYRSRADRSLKLMVAGLAIYNPLTLALVYQAATGQGKLKPAGAATVPNPARRPSPTLTADDRVIRNLRMLKILSDSYYNRTGTEEVNVNELVGPGKLIPRLIPAEGEDYNTVHLKKGEPIEVKLRDGRTLRSDEPRR